MLLHIPTMKSSYLVAFLFISTGVFSQNTEIDSLLKVLKTQREDTNKINTLFGISKLYKSQRDPDQAMEYQKQALLLSEKLKFWLGKAKAIYYLGNIYFDLRQNYAQALEYYYKSLNLFEELGDKKWISNAHSIIGEVYYIQDNFIESLESYQLSLQLAQEIKDSVSIAYLTCKVGDCYFKLGNFNKAFPLFNSGLHLYETLGSRAPSFGLPWSYAYIGTIYEQYGDSLNAVGDKPSAIREYMKGLSFYEKKLYINKKENHGLSDIAEINIYIGNILIKLGKYSESEKHINTGLKIAHEINFKKLLQFGYETAAKLDSAMGDYKSWIYNYKMFVAYRDSVYNEESKRKSLQAQMQYDFDKKELAAKAEQEKKDAIKNAEISKQKVIRNFSIAGAVGILSLGGFVFYNFRKRKKLESQQALANERLRISRDLHDDMGASLSSISVFSSAVKQKLNNNETHEAQQLLERMSTDAQEMVSGMSEMVWTISPHNDTIEKLTDRLQGYAAGMLTAKNISFQLECEEELKTKKLTMEVRKNVFLIFKEAINNAAKYSGATEVMLNVSKRDNRFVARLSDNGNGFIISSSGRGNGLKNMHQRADEIQSQIEIISEINKGTSVTFECPLPKIGEE